MGEFQQLKALYQSKMGSTLQKYVTYPAGAVGTACVSDGAAAAWAWSAYVQIVAAAAVADPCWLVGLVLAAPAVEACQLDIGIAIGGAGSEVDIAFIPFQFGGTPTAVGIDIVTPIFLPFPIRINGTPRLSCKVRKSTGASAAGGTLKLICMTGLGT